MLRFQETVLKIKTVKHQFEIPESKVFKKFKTETLIEASSVKITRICKEAISSSKFPKPKSQFAGPFVLPSCSRWFSFSKVTEIEKIHFPEISDFSLRQEYISIRNLFVKIYRLYPFEDVTISTVRHAHGGDFTFIKKIYEFLKDWGIINFHQIPYQGESRTPQEASLYKSFIKVYEDLNPNAFIPKLFCSLCKTETSEAHFISKKYPGIIICPRCFVHKDIFRQLGVSHSLFTYCTLAHQSPPDKPPIPNEKKFIEAYETNKGDWNTIAGKFTTHAQNSLTALDCLVFFLRNPFYDGLYNGHLMNHEFHLIPKFHELLKFIGSDTKEVDETNVQIGSETPAFDQEMQSIEEQLGNLWTS